MHRSNECWAVTCDLLEPSLSHMALHIYRRLYIISFCYSAQVWQTDGQTDRNTIARPCIAVHTAVAR